MKIPPLQQSEIDRVVEMAWEDRTTFEAIELQFGLPEKQVIALMRRESGSPAAKLNTLNSVNLLPVVSSHTILRSSQLLTAMI
jgi:membrane-bound lytic murein transglycosylase B